MPVMPGLALQMVGQKVEPVPQGGHGIPITQDTVFMVQCGAEAIQRTSDNAIMQDFLSAFPLLDHRYRVLICY